MLVALLPCGLARANGPNVILITLDGVRWQEVFYGSDPELDPYFDTRPDLGAAFPSLWKSLEDEGLLIGNLRRNDAMTTKNWSILSLPGYQSIMVGRTTRCLNNSCKRVDSETVLERVKRELGLSRDAVATFASWPNIERAVEKQAGATTVNVGLSPFVSSDGSVDPVTEELNRQQLADAPVWAGRYDRHTWAQAMRYLERYSPRFLYIGLGDADEWGHLGNYDRYFESLRSFDERLRQLFEKLATLPGYAGNTSVIVTTDHGRGTRQDWKDHGLLRLGSNHVWLYARTPLMQGKGRTQSDRGPYTHLNIRPTIEKLFGLKPCKKCSEPIWELLGR